MVLAVMGAMLPPIPPSDATELRLPIAMRTFYQHPVGVNIGICNAGAVSVRWQHCKCLYSLPPDCKSDGMAERGIFQFFAKCRSWILKKSVPKMAISNTDTHTMIVFISFSY